MPILKKPYIIYHSFRRMNRGIFSKQAIQKGVIICCSFLVQLVTNAQQKTLPYYLDSALQNSPLLYDYQNQILLNRLDSLRIIAANKVQVTGAGNAIYAPVINGFGYDKAISNGGNYSALITANKPITSKSNLTLQFDALRFLSDSLRINARLTEADIKRSIAIQYITAYGNMMILKFNEEINSVLQKEEVLLKKLTEQSVYRQTDYLTFVVALKQQQITLQQSLIQYKSDLYTLNYLAGIPDTSYQLLDEPSLEVQQFVNIDSSLFFQQSVNDSLRLANAKALIAYSYKPKIGLYSDGGFNSTLTGPAYKHFGVSFGVNLTVPIYDGRQQKMQYDKIDIQQRTRERYRQFQIVQYRQQTAQLRLQLTETNNLIKEIDNQLKYSEGLVSVNRKLLQTGDARMTDYVLSLNSYISAKNQLTQNIINRMQIINQFNYWNR